MSRLLPEGLNDPSMYDVSSKEVAQALDDGECSHCDRPVTGKQRFYSYRRHHQELCWSCVQKKNNGELGDPKHDIEPDDILSEYGDKTDLPF